MLKIEVGIQVYLPYFYPKNSIERTIAFFTVVEPTSSPTCNVFFMESISLNFF